MIYLANALQLPYEDKPDPNRPFWDTLMALRNLTATPVTARIRLRRDDASIVMWPTISGPEVDHCDVILEPGLMWAGTFIPGNGFNPSAGADALPPQNWQGGATIECLQTTPLGHMEVSNKVLGFFLLAFNSWHNGVNASYRKDYGFPKLSARRLWQFAYAIPYFDDSAGVTQRIWTTGILINNQGASAGAGRLVYTIAQTYEQKGQSFTIPFKVGAYQKLRFDLYLGNPATGIPGLKDVGYPQKLNSEGHFDVITDQDLLLQPSALIADQQYDFTVTEEEAA